MSSSYSSLNWVLSHWAHFTAARFIYVYFYVFIYFFILQMCYIIVTRRGRQNRVAIVDALCDKGVDECHYRIYYLCGRLY